MYTHKGHLIYKSRQQSNLIFRDDASTNTANPAIGKQHRIATEISTDFNKPPRKPDVVKTARSGNNTQFIKKKSYGHQFGTANLLRSYDDSKLPTRQPIQIRTANNNSNNEN